MSRSRGISLPKNLVHLWQKSFCFQEKSIKICINPFVLKKSRTLFQISELSLGLGLMYRHLERQGKHIWNVVEAWAAKNAEFRRKIYVL